MNNENPSPVGAPVDPVTHPVVTHKPNPTEPQGAPDPPEEPNPFPITTGPLPPEPQPGASQK